MGACVGGFYKAPSHPQIKLILEKAKERISDCEALIHWLASLSLPDNSHDFTSVSLYHPTEYPMNEGRIVSDRGLNITKEEFDAYFKEHHVDYSMHCTVYCKINLI